MLATLIQGALAVGVTLAIARYIAPGPASADKPTKVHDGACAFKTQNPRKTVTAVASWVEEQASSAEGLGGSGDMLARRYWADAFPECALPDSGELSETAWSVNKQPWAQVVAEVQSAIDEYDGGNTLASRTVARALLGYERQSII